MTSPNITWEHDDPESSTFITSPGVQQYAMYAGIVERPLRVEVSAQNEQARPLAPACEARSTACVFRDGSAWSVDTVFSLIWFLPTFMIRPADSKQEADSSHISSTRAALVRNESKLNMERIRAGTAGVPFMSSATATMLNAAGRHGLRSVHRIRHGCLAGAVLLCTPAAPTVISNTTSHAKQETDRRATVVLVAATGNCYAATGSQRCSPRAVVKSELRRTLDEAHGGSGARYAQSCRIGVPGAHYCSVEATVPHGPILRVFGQPSYLVLPRKEGI
jgi:hypothetical protein